MIQQALIELFNRDLNKLKQEIEAYEQESAMWIIEKNIKNSAGNLCLHLIGNLKAFIGLGLGKVEYTRQRDLEFSAKNIPRAELLKAIDETIVAVNEGLSQLSDEQLQGNFPVVIWQKETGMAFTLIHLHAHLNYHLGQINYHRRILG